MKKTFLRAYISGSVPGILPVWDAALRPEYQNKGGRSMGRDKSVGDVALGVLAGMAVGMAVTYAMSGDAVLLRRNMRRVERGAERAIHRVERRMR